MKSNKILRKIAAVFWAIQFLSSLITVILIIQLDVLPAKYFTAMVIVLLVLFIIGFLLQRSKKLKIAGIIYSILISVLLAIGCYYVGKTNEAITDITGSKNKTDMINVYVLKEDPAENILDAKGYNFGYLENLDRTNTDQTVEKINTELKEEIDTESYQDSLAMTEALYQGTSQALVLNGAFVDIITEQEGYEDFLDKTKMIASYPYTTQVEAAESVETPTQESFSVYISGIDTAGDISSTSRSDVNIIATVNPQTKQILLLSTPRDYFIPLSISKGAKDKLTHAGIYGVDVSVDTLELLYDIDINYYFRLNFTGFKQIIDALGGIEVWSDYSFTTAHGGYAISEGTNTLSGDKALGFSRERYAFSAGDRQRGKNQMEVIKGVLKKAGSSAILGNYSTVLDGLKGTFDTNMSSDQISDLIKMQIAQMPSWNVVSYSVDGSGASSATYSMPGSHSYVMNPDQSTVDKAKELIRQVKDGEILSN